ncbi:amidohydrolase family protein [Gracilimonas mengyeensis]|uniref:Imidazolonepropionase n=1 Tax=Gracilimonas mengyeensis TaxID=1302730 RepID=A0A521D5D5_9BACT|nr:amidohydrolase family protein [Gracilimonas mengyeensis]SMO66875.1 Imidazolonepropionase [Gracilimonas mengyeensis]
MKKLNIFIVVAALLFGLHAAAQAQITEKPGFGKYAITGATIHTVTNGTIESGIILIDGNEISFVGKNAKITDDYARIDASGKHVYPGFIDGWTALGLVEVSAVAVTVDNQELGDFNPHMYAFTAFNPHSASVPVTRVSGVTTVLSAPSSGIIAGKAAVMDLWGYSPDSMAVAKSGALVMELPSSTGGGWWDDRSEEEIKKEYEQEIKEINDFFEKARFYDRMVSAYEGNPSGKTKPDHDPRMEAMREVLSGEVPVVIEVGREQEILEAIKWTESQEGLNVIFAGVEEGWRVAEEIAEAGIPVLTTTLYTPSRDYDNYQRPYQNPGLMAEAGVKVAIVSDDTENSRNAPFEAGYAAAYGLGKEEAIKALTINPAEIFGVDDKLGSLEAGKQANLFISDGDPLQPMTNIEQVFIKGYKIPMDSRHIQLYEEFLDRDAVSTEE